VVCSEGLEKVSDQEEKEKVKKRKRKEKKEKIKEKWRSKDILYHSFSPVDC